MKVVYRGPHPEVEVDETGDVAVRDEPVEIRDNVAKRLLEQDTWEPANPPKPPKPAAAPIKES